MSSMRNAVQRRNHKERAQPRERERWGLLEKHKDYALRAKDYNEKKKKLKTLRQKAAERNPDEFHFGMMSHRLHDGAKTSTRSPYASMPHATAQLLKTQDAGYLRTMIQSTRKARQRLREDLTIQETRLDGGLRRGSDGMGDEDAFDEDGDDDVDDDDNVGEAAIHTPQKGKRATTNPAQRRHIVFVNDREEQKTYDRWSSRSRVQDVDAMDNDDDDDDDNNVLARENEKSSKPNSHLTAHSHSHSHTHTHTRTPYASSSTLRNHSVSSSSTKAASKAEDMRQDRQRREEESKATIAAQAQKLQALRERETALVAAEQQLEMQRARMSQSIGGVTQAGHRFRIRERKK